jgi:hypothetical protein
MKKLLPLICCLIGILPSLKAQFIKFDTVPPLSGGGNTAGGISFNLTAKQPIIVDSIRGVFATTTGTCTLWYNPTSKVNGPPNVSTANGWVNLGSATFAGISTATTAVVVQTIPIGISIPINPTDTFGFFIQWTGNVYPTTTVTVPTEYTDGAVSILSGANAGYAGTGTTPTFTPRTINGGVVYHMAITCGDANSLTAASVTTTSASLSWNGPGAVTSYDYIVSTSAIPPTSGFLTTTGTTYNASSLTPGTTYYLHVRAKCGTTTTSWVTKSFQTLEPCTIPTPLNIADITTNSATIKWTTVSAATEYEYYLDTVRTLPLSGYSHTMNTTLNVTDLESEKWYYFHVRSKCPGGLMSSWYLDSFKTRKVCPAPYVEVEHINTNRAVAYWNRINEAVSYEYALTTSNDAPTEGTKVTINSFHASALKDGVNYYYHLRCNCDEGGYLSNSAWTTVGFKTFPTNINGNTRIAFDIKAYPNPVHNEVLIAVEGGSKNKVVLLQDISGRTIQRYDMSDDIMTVDMQQMSAGMYMLKYMDDEHTKTIKISKQ